ncbi:MAG: PspA/IM30 family protein [Myxococcales bacterium]|nr:PspA/IM30 family protein [Myxococcales bacterium]
MGIFDRAKRAISSNVNSMLDKAEDTRKIVDLTIEEMKEHIARAKQDVIGSVAAEKQLRKQCDELRTQMEKWEQRAVLAVKAGDDALAREALKQKSRLSAELASAEKQREAQLGLALEQRSRLQEMELKVKEVSAKKGTIVAKAEIAKAGGGSEALGAKPGSNAFEEFRKMEEKIDEQDAHAQALRELDDDAIKDAELESKFRRLEASGVTPEGGPSAVDDELAALKKRVRVSS